METCKAVVQEGPRKGKTCQFPPDTGGYCGRHLRNKEYDEGIASGKRWCRFFFRGCSAELPQGKASSCLDCRAKITKKELSCKHEGCPFKINSGDYCKKHERDVYRNDGNRYCDIDRGCFTILHDKAKSCDTCLEATRKTDNARYAKKKTLHTAAVATESIRRTCVGCTNEFEAFLTRYGKESVNCKECSEKQKLQDENREDRVRNYKEEHSRHLDSYYKIHIEKSRSRGHGDFQIDFKTFTGLVQQPCHYCKEIKENEVNGIDRVNNSIGYTKENCVPACWKCNRMKHFYHPTFFLTKCKIMIKEEVPTKQFYKEWATYYTRSSYRNYTAYKRLAEERGLPFTILQDQWNWLTRSPCYLCRYQDAHGIGLDRVDNTIRSYTLENSRPCCGSCNTMKGELSLEGMLTQCKKVSAAWPTITDFKDIPIGPNPLKKAEEKGDILQPEDRKVWKAKGLYYSILSKTASSFLEWNKDVYTVAEFNELCNTIPDCTVEKGVEILRKLLVTLKKRRVRQSTS